MDVICSGKKSTLIAVNVDCYKPPKVWKSKDGNEYSLVKEDCDWKIVDPTCAELHFVRIKNWITKTGIKYIGDNALTSMMKANFIKDIDDLYKLNYDEVAKLPVGNGVIGANAKKIKEEIEKTKNLPIDIFIGSLSIKYLGRSRAELLGFKSIKEFLDLTVDNLVGKRCSETGTFSINVAKEVIESIQSRKEIIKKLANVVHVIVSEKENSEIKNDNLLNGKMSGVIMCFTGCRPNDVLRSELENEGAIIKSSVTKDCTHLVCKDKNSTSNKAKKARERGVEVIGLEDLEEMLES
jgi:NAD-dependent DNA ligase